MRYLVFAFDTYYPSGGIQDIVGVAATLDEAKEIALKHKSYDHVEVYDTIKDDEVWCLA